jgi:hypothetical protein
MKCPTEISRHVDEFTKKRRKDIEEVQGWILNELDLEMHLVKEKCNVIRYYDPTQLKEAYKLIRAAR